MGVCLPRRHDDPSFCPAEEIREHVNVADDHARRNGGARHWKYENWNDGFVAHAPVGSFKANPWGLHDIHGNVWEWCRDRIAPYARPVAPGDGLREAIGDKAVASRGGDYSNNAYFSRSSIRNWSDPAGRTDNRGLRPSRPLR